MASLSTRVVPSSSSSSSNPQWRYDVFPSFHGEDIRNSFRSHFLAALSRKGIVAFTDDDKLKRGEDLSAELWKAIKESQCAVVVFSKNYAFSRWCLKELTMIVELWRKKQMMVFPIFYRVDPTDVKKQRGTFAEAFTEHDKAHEVNEEQIKTWRVALKEVGEITGWHVNNRPEAELVEDFSRHLLRELRGNLSISFEGLVGMKSRVEEVVKLLSTRENDVRYIGIHGMGGIGKTTLAEATYKTVSSQYEVSCFLENGSAEAANALIYLQEQLLSELLRDDKIKVCNRLGGVNLIATRLANKKAFIVLDNADQETQIEALVGKRTWFGPGSRILLISRDYRLLKKYVDNTYEVKELTYNEAFQLFSQKAFKKPFPNQEFVGFSKEIVSCANGLPLALEVFASSLAGEESKSVWKSACGQFVANSHSNILCKLKLSFNGLEYIQKQLFLDIACFFNKRNLDNIYHVLESFHYHLDYNIQVLKDKSLIKSSYFGQLLMHDMLVQVGHHIVDQESLKEPSGRSRLWCYEDIIYILKNNNNANAIAVEGISLLLDHGDKELLNLEVFSKMNELRMIEISPKESNFEETFFKITPKNTHPKDSFCSIEEWLGHINPFKLILKDSHPLEFMPKRFEQCLGKLQWVGDHSKFMLSDKLCLINWLQYPLHSLPTTFQSENLVELKLPCSDVKKLWSGSKSFGKLRVIHLNYSVNLIETPDLTKVPNLEKLELSYCTSLSKVHSSIAFLRRLKLLDLCGCKNLKNLPKNLGCVESLEELVLSQTSIKELPSFLCSSKKLKVLKGGGTLSNPISLHFSKSFSSLSSLEYLFLEYCNLRDRMIPNNLNKLSLAKILVLRGNKFKSIPKFVWKLPKLEELDLSHCNLLDGGIPSDISCASSLQDLDLTGNKFTTISNNISQLRNLECLVLSDNSKLQALPKLPCALSELWRSGCPLLDTSSTDKPGSGVRLRKNTFGVSYHGYDGKSYEILHVDSEYTSQQGYTWFEVDVACGPTLEYEIHEWFETRSNGSYEIQGRMQKSEIRNLRGIALFIVYEGHESSNSEGSNDSNPAIVEIACQMRCERAGSESLESRVIEVSPSERTGFERRRNGVWVFLSKRAFRKCFKSCNYPESVDFTLSVSAKSPNIEVKEYGIRGVYEADKEDWCRVLSEISFHGWAPKSFEDFYSHSSETRFYF